MPRGALDWPTDRDGRAYDVGHVHRNGHARAVLPSPSAREVLNNDADGHSSRVNSGPTRYRRTRRPLVPVASPTRRSTADTIESAIDLHDDSGDRRTRGCSRFLENFALFAT